MDKLKKSVFDDKETILKKNKTIESYMQIEKDSLYDKEIELINHIVKKLSFILPRESFSCKHGILMYSFNHEDKDREVYISPEVYLIDGDCVVYEVINHKKYFQVTTNQILISKENKYFCEIPLKQFLKYVCAEDIVSYIDNYINKDYEEFVQIQKRIDYLKNFK